MGPPPFFSHTWSEVSGAVYAERKSWFYIRVWAIRRGITWNSFTTLWNISHIRRPFFHPVVSFYYLGGHVLWGVVTVVHLNRKHHWVYMVLHSRIPFIIWTYHPAYTDTTHFAWTLFTENNIWCNFIYKLLQLALLVYVSFLRFSLYTFWHYLIPIAAALILDFLFYISAGLSECFYSYSYYLIYLF